MAWRNGVRRKSMSRIDDCTGFKLKMQFEIAKIREMFIRRMTVDSDHNDRRRKDYNQAIFHYESDEDVDRWNAECERYGFKKKKYGRTYPVWCETNMDMVLRCWDNAVKDYFRQMEV